MEPKEKKRAVRSAGAWAAESTVEYLERALASAKAYVATGESSHIETCEWFCRHAHEYAAKAAPSERR